MNIGKYCLAALCCTIILSVAVRSIALEQLAAKTAETTLAMSSPSISPDVDEKAVKLNELADVKQVATSKSASTGTTLKASDIVRELYNSYMQENGLHEGANGDQHFYFASRQVNQLTTSPDFGKSRVMAFEQAYHDALKQFVKSVAISIKTEVARDFFSDTSTDTGTFSEDISKGRSSIEAMTDKAIALGDAFLSSKLKSYGVDPEKYKASPPDQKKLLLRDAFIRKTATLASKRLGGVVPIQTFIGDSGNGQQSVGVLILYSPKLEAIAKSLSREQKPKIVKKGHPLSETVPLNNPEKLYDLLGVRVLFDENGPVIVSYGQWSNSYNGSDERSQERYRNIAFDKASSQALAQIAAFLSTNFSSQEENKSGELMEQAKVKRGEDNMIEDINTDVLIDISTEKSRQRSQALLRGASTLNRWIYTTPEGHEIVGVIKTYSFAGIETAKKTSQQQQEGSKSSAAPIGKKSGRKSVDQMKLKDF